MNRGVDQAQSNVNDLETQVQGKKTESDELASETRRVSYVGAVAILSIQALKLYIQATRDGDQRETPRNFAAAVAVQGY